MTDKATVDLSGAAKTMLTTLYLKALDADFERPVLGDTFARDAVQRLEYDWADLGVTGKWAPIVTVRTAQYDTWARDFLRQHPEATVIHVGAGLDCRVFRLDPGPEVRWYDVDFPQVIDLRRQIYPSRDNYELIPTSAEDPSWLDAIPADRPTLFLAEGISMYLTESDGLELLRHVVDRFGHGEIQIDFYNWLAIKSQKVHKLNRTTGSTLFWAVNTPDDVVPQVPGLAVVDARNLFSASTFERASGLFRAAGTVSRIIPPARESLQYHRYSFDKLS